MYLREEGVAEAPLVVSAREREEERPMPCEPWIGSIRGAPCVECMCGGVCVGVVCECAPRGAELSISH